MDTPCSNRDPEKDGAGLTAQGHDIERLPVSSSEMNHDGAKYGWLHFQTLCLEPCTVCRLIENPVSKLEFRESINQIEGITKYHDRQRT